MTGLLLALALLAEPCEALVKQEKRLERTILALENDDPRLPHLFEEWDRAVAEVDACRALVPTEAPAGN